MTTQLVILILGLAFLRLAFGGRRHWRHAQQSVLEQKVAKLEAVVADLQEQAEQDRALIGRLDEERAFLTQLYAGSARSGAEPRAPS